MQLFEDEKVMVTGLDYVLLHRGDGKKHDYSTHLTRCELIFKLSGRCRVWFDGQEMLEETGDVRFLPKGNHRVDYRTEPIEIGDSIYFRFDLASSIPESAVLIHPKNSEQMRALFEKLHGVWMLHERGYYQRSMALIYQIIACLQEQMSEGYLDGKQSQAIRRSMTYLEEHCFDPNFDYQTLAESSGVSYSYFKRLFIKRYGVPPSRYVLLLRMRRACELLEAGLLNIGQTAEAVGFEDQAYFCRIFSREMGASPTMWRKGRNQGENS